MPRKAVKAKPKPKGKKQQVAKGRDIAQFRGTGAQVIVQIPRTRRARTAPVRQARAAAIMPQPMMPRPDALTGQQTQADRIQQQLGVLQDTLSRTRSEQAARVAEGQSLAASDLGARVADIEKTTRNLQQQLVAEQTRLKGIPGVFDRPPSGAMSAAPTPPMQGAALPASFTVLQLKEMLRNAGQPVSGTKEVLMARARAAGLIR